MEGLNLRVGSNIGSALVGALTLNTEYIVWLTNSGGSNTLTGGFRPFTGGTATTNTVAGVTDPAAATRVVFGSGPYYGSWLTGSMREGRIWTRTLTTTEINAERDAGESVADSSNLVGHFRFLNAGTVTAAVVGTTLTSYDTGQSYTTVTDWPEFPSSAINFTVASTLGALTCAADMVAGNPTIVMSLAATLGAVTLAAQMYVRLDFTVAATLQPVTSTGFITQEQMPISWLELMPHISLGKPIYGTGADLADLIDNGYGYSDEAWAVTGGSSWAALNLGAGPKKILIALSNDNASGSWITNAFEAYRLQVSNDSTNGADGTWTTVVTVTGNNRQCREHLLDFRGYSWVKLLIDTASQGQIDEFDVWDATLGTPDTFAFLGDSITDGAVRRYEYFGGGMQPSFQRQVATRQPGHYPALFDLGAIGQGAEFWEDNIDTALSQYPDVRYWCITLGTNDGPSMPGGLAAWVASMEYVIDAILAAGKIPVLARAPYTGSAIYGGGPAYEGNNLKYLNDNGVDALVATYGLRTGPDLYQLFWDERTTYNVTADPHPNETGYKGWIQAWTDSFGEDTNPEGIYFHVSQELAPLTSAASLEQVEVVGMTVAATLQPLVSSSVLAHPRVVTVTAVLAPATSVAALVHPNPMTVAVTLGSLTSAAALTAPRTMSVSATLGGLTSSASLTHIAPVGMTVAANLQALTSTAIISQGTALVVAATLQPLTTFAQLQYVTPLSVTAELGPATSTASMTPVITTGVAVSLQPLTAVATLSHVAPSSGMYVEAQLAPLVTQVELVQVVVLSVSSPLGPLTSSAVVLVELTFGVSAQLQPLLSAVSLTVPGATVNPFTSRTRSDVLATSHWHATLIKE